MENINYLAYIKPELLIVVAVIYALGAVLKKTLYFQDKYIPVVLLVVSILICLCFTFSALPLFDVSAIFGAIFDAVIQGVLITACAVYSNQVYKQLKKEG